MIINGLSWRCPDKPIRTAQDTLPSFDKEGGYIATYKLDGWRCIIDWDGENVKFFSRRDAKSGGPTIHPVCESLAQEAKEFMVTNKMPPNTRLDSEWLARRNDGPEELFIFGIQYLNGEWLGKDVEDLRWTIVETFIYDQPHVQLANSTRENFQDFFNVVKLKNENLHKGQQKVEGIVLKRNNSKLCGNTKICKVNQSWFKIKWRCGSSGHTPTF